MDIKNLFKVINNKLVIFLSRKLGYLTTQNRALRLQMPRQVEPYMSFPILPSDLFRRIRNLISQSGAISLKQFTSFHNKKLLVAVAGVDIGTLDLSNRYSWLTVSGTIIQKLVYHGYKYLFMMKQAINIYFNFIFLLGCYIIYL